MPNKTKDKSHCHHCGRKYFTSVSFSTIYQSEKTGNFLKIFWPIFTKISASFSLLGVRFCLSLLHQWFWSNLKKFRLFLIYTHKHTLNLISLLFIDSAWKLTTLSFSLESASWNPTWYFWRFLLENFHRIVDLSKIWSKSTFGRQKYFPKFFCSSSTIAPKWFFGRIRNSLNFVQKSPEILNLYKNCHFFSLIFTNLKISPSTCPSTHSQLTNPRTRLAVRHQFPFFGTLGQIYQEIYKIQPLFILL